MIQTRHDLKEYIRADRERNPMPASLSKNIIRRIPGLHNDAYRVRNYLKVLRHLEYHNNNKDKSFLSKIGYAYYVLWYLRLANKYKIFIQLNNIGKGVFIPHHEPFIVINCIRMGDYCTLNRGAHVGNKGSQENRATIGNNVEITTGAKVFGKVTIGDNAIVCPNSVVIKDVPANAIVSGVPAKLVKIREV